MSGFLRRNRKMIALLMIAGGAVLILAGLLADRVGVGAHPTVFGWKQIAALAVGGLMALGGILGLAFPHAVMEWADWPEIRLPDARRNLAHALVYHRTSTASGQRYIWVWMPILGAVLLAAALRFHGLTFQSLWGDEIISYFTGSANTIGMLIARNIAYEDTPPLITFIARLTISLMGDGAFQLRFPMALFGVLGVAIIYRLGTLMFSREAGLLAAVFLAVMQMPLYYSQEARIYSVLIFISCLTTYFWFHMLKELARDSTTAALPGIILAYTICAIMTVYTHYMGLLLIALQGIAAGLQLLRKLRSFRHLVIVYGIVGLCYAPWVGKTLQSAGRAQFWTEAPGDFLKAFTGVLSAFMNNSMILVGIAGLLVLIALFETTEERREWAGLWPKAIVAVLWLCVPIVLIYLKSVISISLWTNRYLVGLIPALYLLTAAGAARLLRSLKFRQVLISVCTVLLLLDLVFRVQYFSRPTKPQFRESVAYIAAHEPAYSGRSIIIALTSGGQIQSTAIDYYFAHLNSTLRTSGVVGLTNTDKSFNEVVTTQKPDYVWLVNLISWAQPDEKIMSDIAHRFTLLDHKKWIGAEVWLYKTTPPTAGSDTPAGTDTQNPGKP